ncbi:MAG TPA: hypothetical protein VG742_06020 [Dongiaceae bacterium]|nr:hypothetical protein [Dongiaceae bacterium]
MPLRTVLLCLPVPLVATLLVHGAMAQSTEAPGAATTDAPPTANVGSEWPCEQPLRRELSVGAVWSGPDPQNGQDSWRQSPAIAALVSQIAPRHTAQEEAIASIRRFAAGYEGTARAEALTALFGGLFETLNAERNDIVRGIKRFNRRQDALARRIEEGWKELGELDANTTDLKVAEQRVALQQQVDWDARIFDDRQRLLPAVCEQPRVLEQRLFALSRAIQEELPAGQP